MVIATFLLDELYFQSSKDKKFTEWRQHLTHAKPVKDDVIPQLREGDVSTRYVHCTRKVPTIKKFAVLVGISAVFLNDVPPITNSIQSVNQFCCCCLKNRVTVRLRQCSTNGQPMRRT